MYKHIVLWKIRASVNGMTRSEISIEVKRRLDELPAHIPEIVDYETAINIGDYGASFFDVSLVSTFENKDAFWTYVWPLVFLLKMPKKPVINGTQKAI